MNDFYNLHNWVMIFKKWDFYDIRITYRINPFQNRFMMTDNDMKSEINAFESFLKNNKKMFTFERRIIEMKDYDYIQQYESLQEMKDKKVWLPEVLQKTLVYWNGKLLQSSTKWTFNHEYLIHFYGFLTKDSDKVIQINNFIKETDKYVQYFPYKPSRLWSTDIVRLYLKSERFFWAELLNLTDENLLSFNVN